MKTDKLEKMLSPYSSWYDIEGEEGKRKNEESKRILIVFYNELEKIKPSKYYDAGRFHTSYLLQLIPLKKAFEEQRYMRVCHELETLLHYEPLTQPRIYYNVLKLLEQYLDV